MARTGSGKTAAFLVPTVQRLREHSTVVGVRAVVLSPTRELALQTAKFARQLGKNTDLRICILVGGMSMESQFDRLASNPDLIIATPGRLMCARQCISCSSPFQNRNRYQSWESNS